MDSDDITSYADEFGNTIYYNGHVCYTDEKRQYHFSDGSYCHVDAYGKTTCDFYTAPDEP